MLKEILLIIQTISVLVLSVSILLQSQGSGLSGIFGGEMASFHTRRGAEKFIFAATIISAAVLFLSLIARFLLINGT